MYNTNQKNIMKLLPVYVHTLFIIMNNIQQTCKFNEYQLTFLLNGLSFSDYNGIVYPKMLNLRHVIYLL